MKKNRMMRIAAVMMVLALVTTCVISGSFAKYVTTGEGSDSARVAKWGVTVTANGAAFGNAYKAADGKISATYAAATDSVHGEEGAKVVAPGTGDSVVAMTISGTPEVDCEVAFEAEITLDGWGSYCPIVFTIGEDDPATTDVNEATVISNPDPDALKAAVEAAIAAYTANYEAGQDLSNAEAPAISWEWPFSTSEANDVKDTALGNATTKATIAIAITTTITQVD